MASKYKPPLVTIVIPTWQRHELLFETLAHINQQTYKNLDIIVVCDGQDSELAEKLTIESDFISPRVIDPDINITLIELGHNWSGWDRSSFGIAPLLVGYLCARGDYVMPWCDDERALVKDHIEKLVDIMGNPCIEPDWCNADEKLVYPDFAYSRVKIWRNGYPDGPETAIIGKCPPEHGQITHYIFSPYNFVKFGYPDWGTHPVDWSLIQKWMKNGASYVMLDEVTFSHRLDQ